MRRFTVVLLFAAVAAVYTYPLSVSPSRVAVDLGPDTRLFLWTLSWDVHALTSRPLSIFDANIFHPETRTLAYSEHQIGSALLAAPVAWATDDLLLSMNVVLLLSCLGAGVAAYYLARTLGLGTGAAVLTGLVFALTPPRFFRIGQLHLATVYWMPIALAFVHRYANEGRRPHLVIAVLAFTLQALFGAQSALFLALALASLILFLAIRGELPPRSKLLPDAILAAALLLALNLPFAMPYLHVQRELGLERSLEEAAAWSPNPESFVASPTHADRALLRALGSERDVIRDARAFLFPGLVPLGLALAGAIRFPGKETSRARRVLLLDGAIVLAGGLALLLQMAGGARFEILGVTLRASSGARAMVALALLVVLRAVLYRRAREPFSFLKVDFYLLLALVSLWLALGPEGGLYAWLYRFLPGFDFIRVPSRFTILTVLAIAVLAGVGLERLSSRWRSPALPLAFGALVLVELAAFPLDTVPYAITTSPMDRWLAENGPPGAVAVLPVPDPRDAIASARSHSAYMLQSTAHFRPLVNGYSGFTPESHERLFSLLSRFPHDGDEGLAALETLGVRYMILHRAGYRDDAWSELVELMDAAAGRVELEATFEEGRVYELERSMF